MTTPSPTSSTFNPDTVTPGVWGFIVILVVALATIGLIIDMTRRLRRQRYLAEIEAREAALAAKQAESGPQTPPARG